MDKKKQLTAVEKIALLLWSRVNKNQHPTKIVRDLIKLVEKHPLTGISRKKVMEEAINLFIYYGP